MKEDQETAARLQLGATGILEALGKAGIGEDPAELASALGITLGCLAQATTLGELFLDNVMKVARAAMNGELDGTG